jgi:hypothetical protein
LRKSKAVGYVSGTLMLLLGFFLLVSVAYPYVKAETNDWQDYYAGNIPNAVSPTSASIGAGQTASFYCSAGNTEDDVNWFIDGTFFVKGHNLLVDSSVGVGEHEVYALITYYYGAEYPQVFDTNRAILTVLSSTQPTPSPTATPSPTVTPYPTATQTPFLTPTPSSNPIDDLFNNEDSLIQNGSYQIFASVACFPLIVSGCITVFVAKRSR